MSESGDSSQIVDKEYSVEYFHYTVSEFEIRRYRLKNEFEGIQQKVDHKEMLKMRIRGNHDTHLS